jgi:hypothetical protein
MLRKTMTCNLVRDLILFNFRIYNILHRWSKIILACKLIHSGVPKIKQHIFFTKKQNFILVLLIEISGLFFRFLTL